MAWRFYNNNGQQLTYTAGALDAPYLVQSAYAAFSAYRIATGSSSVTVADGGALGNMTFSINATWLGQTSITTLGTITSGTWQGTTIAVINGGTGGITAGAARTNLGLAIGSNVEAWNAQLDTLAAYNTNGLLTQTSVGVYTGRTVTGTTGTITVSNGDGVAGNPTITISAAYLGQTSITTLGTVTTGVWTGTSIALANGGTSAALTASNGGIVYSTASAMAILAGTATASKMLLSGASTTPTWSTSTIPTSAGSTANKVLLSDGTNYVLSIPTFPNASATSGKIIRSDGTNWVASTPTFPTGSPTAGQVLSGDGTNWIAQGITVLQRVSVETGAVATGGTALPYDDTIPQNTEGDQYMTLAITPVSATSKLVIDTTWIGDCAGTGDVIQVALFQDSTANALASIINDNAIGSLFAPVNFKHIMTSGTTSATTFKVRCGSIASTVTFNGSGGARKHGGILASSIVITEYSS